MYIGPFQLFIYSAVLIVLIWVIVRILNSITKKLGQTTKSKKADEAMETLRLRLSKGEISEAQFESMKILIG